MLAQTLNRGLWHFLEITKYIIACKNR